jgi:HPt (histidine-containing phosphotransfer) domain-containing protein
MTDGTRIVVQIDPDLMPLIPDFLAHRREDVEVMERALAGGDFAAIRVVGHNMRGCGSGYGFPVITDLGTALEQAALHKDAPAVQKCVDDLASYLERVDVV